MSSYFVKNSFQGEGDRLALLETLEDPQSFAALEQLNIAQGSRCLEVGAGRCSVLLWLAQQIGPTGSVLGVDIDTALVPGSLPANARIVQCNVVVDEIPGGPFDFIHSRAVLMHIDERDDVFAKLLAALAPGGTLFLEESDAFPLEASESELLRRVFLGPAKRWRWARGLPARMHAAGLVDIAVDIQAPIFQGGSPTAQFYSWTMETARPTMHVRDDSTTDELIDAAIAQLGDPAVWTPILAMCRVSGRRPIA